VVPKVCAGAIGRRSGVVCRRGDEGAVQGRGAVGRSAADGALGLAQAAGAGGGLRGAVSLWVWAGVYREAWGAVLCAGEWVEAVFSPRTVIY
jgi:hypothetical protein